MRDRYLLYAGSGLLSISIRVSNYYMAQGRAIRRMVSLFDNIEDLVAENDRRLEDDNDEDSTIE